MSDIIDQANDRAAADLERSIAAARRKAESEANQPLPTHCINDCGEPARERSRYCSSECREDHEARMQRAKRQGVR